jgi:integrase
MTRKATTARLHTRTAREIHAAKKAELGDGGGLSLRVSATGANWVLRYTAPTGKRREMGLGVADRANVAQAGQSLTTARQAAHEARELLRQCIDPLDAREQRRQAVREAEEGRKADASRERWTLARCARDYHERVIERTRTDKHSAQWISSLEHHMPAALWHAPIGSITPPALLQALADATPHERARRPGDLGETLRRVRQRLDAVFEDAMFYGRCEANPAAAIKRKLRETRPANDKGQFLALDYRQAQALLTRVRALPGTAARCLEFAVLTASRTSEALLASWDEFDLDRAVWTIKAERMKAGEAHFVPLSARAVEIVRAQAGQHDRMVFPTPQPGREGKAMSNMALLATLDRLGVRDRTTVHGLCRATFSTWANDTEAARPDVIEACLAHREGDLVRAAYNRAEFNTQRRALIAAWADFLAQAASNVVPLRAA